MGRLYSKGHGKSKSITPYRRYTDEWRGITFLNVNIKNLAISINRETIN
jgi:hypothetical protein